MEIYYGQFLEATKIMVTGKTYCLYFNSEEAVYKYSEYLKERGKHDILEVVGKAYFNSRGRLVEDDENSVLVYNPFGEDDE